MIDKDNGDYDVIVMFSLRKTMMMMMMMIYVCVHRYKYVCVHYQFLSPY